MEKARQNPLKVRSDGSHYYNDLRQHCLLLLVVSAELFVSVAVGRDVKMLGVIPFMTAGYGLQQPPIPMLE